MSLTFQFQQNAVITLQRLLRGCASRTKTNYELSRRLDLVNEIRSTHILLESERLEKEADKRVVMDARLADKNARIEMAKVAEVAQTVAGSRVSEGLRIVRPFKEWNNFRTIDNSNSMYRFDS